MRTITVRGNRKLYSQIIIRGHILVSNFDSPEDENHTVVGDRRHKQDHEINKLGDRIEGLSTELRDREA
jgi:hypothetical protein